MIVVLFNNTGYTLASVFLDPMLILSALYTIFITLTVYYLIAKSKINAKYKLNAVRVLMLLLVIFYLHMLSLFYAPDSILANIGGVISNSIFMIL